MIYLITLTLATLASAAKLDKVYLPPNSASSSGAAAGLQTPYRGQGASQKLTSPGSEAASAQILKYENEMTAEGFRYAYETSDGTKAEQNGRIIPGQKPEEGSLQVTGSFSYIGDDGQTYSVTYTADENGFRAEGAHLPTPPPVAGAGRSMRLTAASGGQYSSKRSSYDADNGY